MKKVIIKIPEKRKTTTVAIRMDEDVKRWFKAKRRKGYTKFMSEVLKAYMESYK